MQHVTYGIGGLRFLEVEVCGCDAGRRDLAAGHGWGVLGPDHAPAALGRRLGALQGAALWQVSCKRLAL